MRTHGTLIKWNDDRGFGFVALPQSREEIFVHVSAFPRDGVRPQVGETISFEVRSGADGKKRAEGVMRAGGRAVPAKRARRAPAARSRNPFGAVFTVAAIGAIGFGIYNSYTSRRDFGGDDAEFSVQQPAQSTTQQFKCDGRTQCSQMTSCAEAVYFLQHCPGTQMDGNNDGEPCEQQWCN